MDKRPEIRFRDLSLPAKALAIVMIFLAFPVGLLTMAWVLEALFWVLDTVGPDW